MRPYQPTFVIKETAQNINFFIAANKPVLWGIARPLFPFILGLYALDAVITGLVYRHDPEATFFVGGIIVSYFYFAFVISWIRVVAIGQDNFTPMNPRQPKQNEMRYILFSLLLPIPMMIAVFLVTLVLMPMGEFVVACGVLFCVFMFFYVFYRLGFFFVALALGEQMTFHQSWHLTQGYVARMIFSTLLASIKTILMLFAYIFSSGFILVGILFAILAAGAPDGNLDALIGPMIEQGRNPLELVDKAIVQMMTFVYYVPAWIYFQPLLLAINATAMVNFYLHVMQNRNDWTVQQ
jgi:hypothetical protein